MMNSQSFRNITHQPSRHAAIVPSNSADLLARPVAIFCKTAGNIVLRDQDGHDETYPMTAGQILPFRPTRVLATGTSGSYIGWYA